MTTLRLSVFRELDTKKWCGARAQGIANNLARYSSELGDRDPEELLPHVREWLEARKM